MPRCGGALVLWMRGDAPTLMCNRQPWSPRCSYSALNLFLTLVTTTADGMPLIARGLLQAKSVAMLAYHVIFSILTEPMQTEAREEVLKVVADMQGVRRLSNLLCPTFDNRHGYDFASGRLGVCPHLLFLTFAVLAGPRLCQQPVTVLQGLRIA